MRTQVQSTAWAGLVLAVLTGCQSTPLSMREGGQQSYSMMMYKAAGATTRPAAEAAVPPVRAAADPTALSSEPVIVAVSSEPVRTPAKVGVAQIGELAPPAVMLDGLRAHPELFRRVLPVTGTFDPMSGPTRAYQSTLSDEGGTAEEPSDAARADQMVRMRSIAGSQGLDYLLVFGGNVDHGNQGSGLQLLDLTIVGAFVVPSHGITVDGRAAGSLIDVRTGRIVLNFSAQAKGSGAAASLFLANAEQGAVMRNKDELIQKLTADVVGQMGDEAKANANR